MRSKDTLTPNTTSAARLARCSRKDPREGAFDATGVEQEITVRERTGGVLGIAPEQFAPPGQHARPDLLDR